MTSKKREEIIHKYGQKLASEIGPFYGSIQINIQDYKYINSNISQSIRPDKKK